MCSSSYIFNKYYLLLLCIITSSLCSEGNDTNSDVELTTTIATTSTATTIDINNDNEEITTIKQSVDEEAQLPVTLLSDDVVFDPNVVLARLSRRDLTTMDKREYREYSNGYDDWYIPHGSTIKRNNNLRKEYEETQYDIPKKIKIYPVFPGK